MNANNICIPGTILPQHKAGGTTGADFLNSIFFVSDGIMLSYIREITGIDGTTLQNWVKRGWVMSPKNKYYSKEHLARILIINMIRDSMQLSKISQLLTYINGDVEDTSDDIVSEALLYDYLCKIISASSKADASLDETICKVTSDYTEKLENSLYRLRKAIKVILLAYRSATYKKLADEEMRGVEAEI